MRIEYRFNRETFSGSEYGSDDRTGEIMRQQYVVEILKSRGIDPTSVSFLEWIKRSIDYRDARTLRDIFNYSSFNPRVKFAHYLQLLHSLERLKSFLPKHNPWDRRMTDLTKAYPQTIEVFSSVLNNLGVDIFADDFCVMNDRLSKHFFGARNSRNKIDQARLSRQSLKERPALLGLIIDTYPHSLDEVWTQPLNNNFQLGSYS